MRAASVTNAAIAWQRRKQKCFIKILYSLIGKNILFGHQDDPCYGVGWKYMEGRSDIRDVTGQYPALYGFDLGRIELGLAFNLDSVPFEKTRLFIREAYDRGGVITLSWHLNNPLTGGTAWDNKPGAVASIFRAEQKMTSILSGSTGWRIFFREPEGEKRRNHSGHSSSFSRTQWRLVLVGKGSVQLRKR